MIINNSLKADAVVPCCKQRGLPPKSNACHKPHMKCLHGYLMRTVAAALHASFLAGSSGMNKESFMLTMSIFVSTCKNKNKTPTSQSNSYARECTKEQSMPANGKINRIAIYRQSSVTAIYHQSMILCASYFYHSPSWEMYESFHYLSSTD